MIDYHCHILLGIDDGCSDLDESLALARVLVAAGSKRFTAPPTVSMVFMITPRPRFAQRWNNYNSS